MRQFAASVTINAPPETIWALLTDAAGYRRWNSTVVNITGRIAAGEKVTVYATTAPGRGFPLKVTEFAPPREMVWTGGMPLGLFTGVRRYTLTPLAQNRVEFAMREDYSGLLAPLITRMIPDLRPSFEAFAADLKRQAEIPFAGPPIEHPVRSSPVD
jgi:hypothetical protein